MATSTDRNKLVKIIDFDKSQKIFLRYIKTYDLDNAVYEFRLGLNIYEFGFTDITDISEWLNSEASRYFDKTIHKFLKKHDISSDFSNLLKDYILTGFRFTLFAQKDDEVVCNLQLPKNRFEAPHYLLKIYDSATADDVARYIKKHKKEIELVLSTQRPFGLGEKINGPKTYHKYLIVSRLKKKKTIELKEILDPLRNRHNKGEDIWSMQVTKTDIIRRIMREKYDTTLGNATIERIR